MQQTKGRPLRVIRDYEFDLDTDSEDALQELLDDLESNPIRNLNVEVLQSNNEAATSHANVPQRSEKGRQTSPRQSNDYHDIASEACHDPLSSHTSPHSVAHHVGTKLRDEAESSLPPSGPKNKPVLLPDGRSPIERFRTAPLKSLSVTDMVSPAWCELQYWYALAVYGKKRRTTAMKQGSEVHRELEKQVHNVVPVAITNREDGWGLRIWNVIQGLRTLRETGLTRELEVWGIIDGHVIGGIIDELSFKCPDPVLETASIEKASKTDTRESLSQQDVDLFFQRSIRTSNDTAVNKEHQVFLADVKTRTKPSLPSVVALKPTVMQLMLYRMLLSDLAANNVSAEFIFDRHGVDPTLTFSDSFLAEVSALSRQEIDGSDNTSNDKLALSEYENHPATELMGHNNLVLLWQLMIEELQLTFPAKHSIGNVLRAEFRTSYDNQIIGSKCFLYDKDEVQRYVEDVLRWWNGERPARGVEIEEAFKCRSCDFADDCTWRKEKLEQAVTHHRQRQRPIHQVRP